MATERGRIASTRRTLARVKRGLAVVSVVVFGAAVAIARSADSRPGAGGTHAQQVAPESDAGSESSDFFGDGGTIAPSQGVPRASTGQS